MAESLQTDLSRARGRPAPSCAQAAWRYGAAPPTAPSAASAPRDDAARAPPRMRPAALSFPSAARPGREQGTKAGDKSEGRVRGTRGQPLQRGAHCRPREPAGGSRHHPRLTQSARAAGRARERVRVTPGPRPSGFALTTRPGAGGRAAGLARRTGAWAATAGRGPAWWGVEGGRGLLGWGGVAEARWGSTLPRVLLPRPLPRASSPRVPTGPKPRPPDAGPSARARLNPSHAARGLRPRARRRRGRQPGSAAGG
jgi:hypothetical protein